MSAPEFVLERNHFTLGGNTLTRTFQAADHVQSLDVFPPATHYHGAALFISNLSAVEVRTTLHLSSNGTVWTQLAFSDYGAAGLLVYDLVPLGQGLIVFLTSRQYFRVTAVQLPVTVAPPDYVYYDFVQYIPRGQASEYVY